MYSQMSATESHSLSRLTSIRSMWPSVWVVTGYINPIDDRSVESAKHFAAPLLADTRLSR